MQSRQGISNAGIITIIVVIVIIAVAASIGTILTGKPISPNTSSGTTVPLSNTSFSTSSVTTISTVTQASSAVTTTLCSTPGTNLTNMILPPTGGANNTLPAMSGHLIKDLLTNFSQMSVSLSFSTGGSTNGTSTTTLFSYSIVGQNATTINGSSYYVVNYTQNFSSASTTPPNVAANSSSTIYFNSAGNATVIKSNTANYTGSLAAIHGYAIMLPFESVFFGGTLFLENAPPNSLTPVNQSTITINGNIQMNVTNYTFTPQFCSSSSSTTSPGTNSTGAIYLQIGKLPTTNRQLLTFLKESYSSPLISTAIITLKLVSMVPTAQATNTTSSTTASRRT